MSNAVTDRVVFLDAPRVYLRPPVESDLAKFVVWFNDPEIRPFIRNAMPMLLSEEKEWLESLPKRKPHNIVLAIVLKEGDRPIGTMGLHEIEPKDGTATTGAVIGEKDCWSMGYGNEAKMALLKHAFHTLNLRKVYSRVHATNGRSLRYSEKCGYKHEATLKEHTYIDGKYVDLEILSVLKADWEALWDEFLSARPKPWG